MSGDARSVAVVGPGAIGCAVAAALIVAGHEPTLCARSAFDRLVVDWPTGDVDRRVTVFTEPPSVEPVDVVFVAVKAHDSAAAKVWFDALVGPGTAVVVLQNGVEHRTRFEPLVSPDGAIVPCVVNLPGIRHEPGRVTVGRVARLTLERSPAAERAAVLLDGSFITADVVDDWLTPAWTKLMLNAASGGVCTLTRTDNLVFHDEEARAIAVQVMREVATVGRAEGADLPEDLPDQVIDGLLARASGHMASIVVDRINGRSTEWDIRNAVVGRLADEHGLEVPINRMLTALMRLGEPPAS